MQQFVFYFREITRKTNEIVSDGPGIFAELIDLATINWINPPSRPVPLVSLSLSPSFLHIRLLKKEIISARKVNEIDRVELTKQFMREKTNRTFEEK